MRLLVFHGYLLSGTGSNVYNANLAATLRRTGHEVHLFSQDRHPERLDFVDAIGRWRDGRLTVQTLREPVRCTAYLPDIGGLLPVYVPDRYEGVTATPFPQLSHDELDRYLDANVAAVGEIAHRVPLDGAVANHLVMGPAIIARALGGSVPYAVVIHGSALEYTVKPHPRFLPYAREGLDAARCVLVGSRHTAESLWAALGDPTLPSRTRLGPPGVDVQAFRARTPETAAAGVRRLVEHLGDEPPSTDAGSSFRRDPAAVVRAIDQLRPGEDRLTLFLGKEILAKGLDLLLAAWPLVLQRQPHARLVVAGFGAWHTTAVRMTEALADGNLAAVRKIAEQGRGAEGGARGPLRHLLTFLDSLQGRTRRHYLESAHGVDQRVVFTGRLEHREIAHLLPACNALVVPSTFPEAYGMVAAEAACCGVLPITADHSGLAEVSRMLEAALPHEVAPWLRYQLNDDVVPNLAACLTGWLEAPEVLRERTRRALARVAHERFSWEGVARTVVAATTSGPDDLPRIPERHDLPARARPRHDGPGTRGRDVRKRAGRLPLGEDNCRVEFPTPTRSGLEIAVHRAVPDPQRRPGSRGFPARPG